MIPIKDKIYRIFSYDLILLKKIFFEKFMIQNPPKCVAMISNLILNSYLISLALLLHNARSMWHSVRFKLSNNGLLTIIPHEMPNRTEYLFNKLSFVIAQGQKNGTPSENQTH